ncbi:hypothetical protein Hanom_Chr04g00332201 [Helianthus anomalus]
MNFKLWSGQRTRVETQLFCPYVGPILPELQKKKKEQAKKQQKKQKCSQRRQANTNLGGIL